ncbi:MAG TPA: 3,4-dihydroxy-2-butanone-4-phosphate synthase, partial [Dehalococcoidia bacterium]|nr:3,4-dihydroxy-2-butanone-4-phosphate synthase [Dehalococcoidia bacterium]
MRRSALIESIEDHRRARRGAGSPLATVEEAIEEFRRGRSVIIVDDEDRENEGDLCIPGQF